MKSWCRSLGPWPIRPSQSRSRTELAPDPAAGLARFRPPITQIPKISALKTAPGVDLVNLQPDTLAMAQDLSTWSLMQGWELEFTSGYRSPVYQLELRARWDAGDRQGLRVRPAASSAHSRGEAVDGVILNDPSGRKLAQLGQYAQLRGYTWGGTFSDPDPVHFAIGGPRRE